MIKTQEQKLLWCLACIQFCLIADFMVLSPMGPILMREFSVGPKELGWLVSAYTFTAAIAGLLGALFVDRFDRRHALLVLLGLFAIGELACAVAPNYQVLLGCRMFCGACAGLAGAMVQTIVGDAIAPERRGAAIGTVMTAFALASVAGVPIGLFFASHFGWHAPFIFILGCVGLVGVASWRYVPSLTSHLQSDAKMSLSGLFRPLQSVLQKPNHLRTFGLIALMMFSSFLVIPFISIYTVANVHIPEKQLALIYFAGGFATLFTSRFIGKIADKVGAKKIFIGLSLIAVISIFLTTHLQPGPIWMVLLVSTLFFIVVPARMIPSGVIVNAAADPHTRGTFLSLSGAIQSLVQGGASLVAAYIISRNSSGEILHYDIVGYLSIAFVLFSIVWVGFVRPFSVVLQGAANNRPNVQG